MSLLFFDSLTLLYVSCKNLSWACKSSQSCRKPDQCRTSLCKRSVGVSGLTVDVLDSLLASQGSSEGRIVRDLRCTLIGALPCSSSSNFARLPSATGLGLLRANSLGVLLIPEGLSSEGVPVPFSFENRHQQRHGKLDRADLRNPKVLAVVHQCQTAIVLDYHPLPMCQ